MLKEGCMHPTRSRAWEQSNQGFPSCCRWTLKEIMILSFSKGGWISQVSLLWSTVDDAPQCYPFIFF